MSIEISFFLLVYQQEAAEQYQKTLRLNPKYADAYANLGIALAIDDRQQEAITHLTEALRIYPDYASARQNLQESRLKQNSGMRNAE